MKIKYGYFSATDDPKKSQEKVKRYFEINETNTYTNMCDVMKVIFTHLCRLKGRCIAVFPHRNRRKISSQ